MLLVDCYWLFSDMTHNCGYVVYISRTSRIVMSHGFHACDPVSAHDLFYGF